MLFKQEAIVGGLSLMMGIPLSKKKKLPSGSFLFRLHVKRSRAPCAGDSKGWAYRPFSNRLTATPALQPRAPAARVRGSNRVSTKLAFTALDASFRIQISDLPPAPLGPISQEYSMLRQY